MSAPKRFFIQPLDEDVTEVILEGEEFTHAKTVLRVEVGTEITLLDNTGKEYEAIVAKLDKRSLTAHITGVNVGDKEPQTPVCLLIGALKGDKTELVVQKATELGVSQIIVFNSRYCSAYMNDNKLERLNKVAHEAAKQCLRQIAPPVVYCDKYEQALAMVSDYQNKIFACEFADLSQTDIRELHGSTAVIVGSEGGFSQEEYDVALQDYGFKGITLGKRILRAETAAITTTSIIMFALGELQ